jgi:hypothetical protein
LFEDDFAIDVVEREHKVLEQLVGCITLAGFGGDTALARMGWDFRNNETSNTDIPERSLGQPSSAACTERPGRFARRSVLAAAAPSG